MPDANKGFTVFSGSASRSLADAAAAHLGIQLAPVIIDRFPDGEVLVQLEKSVRGNEVFIIQSTSPPVNEHFMELVAFVDACRRADASHITAIIPYFGYARSDRRAGERVAIMASTVAGILQSIGVGHVVTLDMHTAQVEGFFHVPVDDVTAVGLLCDAVRDRITKDTVVISPDLGAMRRARAFAEHLGLTVAVMMKRRKSGTEVEISQVAGEVRGHPCLIVDDMISTGGTIVESIRALVQDGAQPEPIVAATHGLFIDNALTRLADAGVREVFVADTVAQESSGSKILRTVSVAPLIAAAIRKLMTNESLKDLCC